MKLPPYSLAEAEKLCADHQYLTGERYDTDNDSNAVIECIAVVPFDELNKQKFIIYYHLLHDAVRALRHEYRGLLFDVMVLGTYTDKYDLLQTDLHKWLAKRTAEAAVLVQE